MTIKHKFVVITAGFAALFAVLMIFDRVRTARTEMLGRVEDRAAYIVSFITDVSSDQLQQANHDAGLKRILKGFAHFSQISYLQVSDSRGRSIYRLSRSGISLDGRTEDADIYNAVDAVYDLRRDMMKDGKSLGTIQLGMSLEGVRESLELLMWRGIAGGIVFLLLTTGSVWLLAVRLGRELDELLALAGQMNSEELPAERGFALGTDTGKIAFALRDAHARLKEEKARRLEAETLKDDFFAMTVHDLKQPLTALKAATDLLFSEEEIKNFSKEQIRSLSKIAGTSLRMLNSMVVDVLNMAKIRSRDYSPEKDRLPLAAFMQECAAENSASVKAAGKKWLFSLPEDMGETWIFADHDMVKRVVGNLVLNAIQYTPQGGAIKLGVRFPSPDRAAIYVSDEGEGIPDGFREEIFKKYKGMGKSSKNIGLGLAFCRMVAESHSALMDVRSEMGKGTEVSFVIPVSR